MLIRALEPTEGLRRDAPARGLADERLLCSGPGRLMRGARHHPHAQRAARSTEAPFELHARSETPEIAAGVRIGITKAAEQPWRYGLKGSPFLSKPFR